MRRDSCKACTMIKAGVKFRISPIHTCFREISNKRQLHFTGFGEAYVYWNEREWYFTSPSEAINFTKYWEI